MSNFHNKAQTKRKKGFTLIELLVVISIIGLLSSIVLAALNGARKKAQASVIVQQFHQLQNAIEMYRLQNGFVPGQIGAPGYPNGVDASDANGIDHYMTDFRVALQTLVYGNLISAIPDAPRYPYNGTDYYFVYDTNRTPIMRQYASQYFACGSTPFRDYMLWAASDTGDPDGILKLMNMSPVNVYQSSDNTYVQTIANNYCITAP